MHNEPHGRADGGFRQPTGPDAAVPFYIRRDVAPHVLPQVRSLMAGLGKTFSRLDAAVAAGTFQLKQEVQEAFALLGGRPQSGADDLRFRSPLAQALYRGTLLAAAAIDKGMDGTQRQPFHNPPHYAAAAHSLQANARVNNRLVLSGQLPPSLLVSYDELAIGTALMFLHDYGHDGRGNMVKGRHEPFRTEAETVRRLGAILRPDPEAAAVLRGYLPLIYATDASVAPGAALSPALVVSRHYEHFFHGAPKPAAPPAMAQKLQTILQNPRRTLVAALMTLSDVTPSLFGQARHSVTNANIAKELDSAPSARSGLYFLDVVLGGSVPTAVGKILFGDFVARQRAAYVREVSPAPVRNLNRQIRARAALKRCKPGA